MPSPLLESLGHTISVAMTGEEAIRIFRPDEYDLVLLDIQLPDMTGFDIAEHFRKTYPSLPPLVALTANVLKEKRDYTENGMDDVLSKPLSVKAIKRVTGEIQPDSTSGRARDGKDQRSRRTIL